MKHCLIFLLILAACNRPTDTVGVADQWLHDAGALVGDAPDSILAVLQTADTTVFNSLQYAEYILLKVQAKDKTDRHIAGDTAIFQAKELLVAAGDTEKAARACFYAGRVLQERDSEQPALRIYLDALQMVKRLENCDYLKGLIHFYIGELHYDKGQPNGAIEHYRTSAGYFERSQQKTNEMFAWNAIGTSFMINKQFDSALYYYNKVSKMPAYTDDPWIQSNVIRNIGIISGRTGESEKARKLFAQALRSTADDRIKAQLYICLSQAYLGLKRTDSAEFYIERALALCEQTPKPPMASVYESLAKIENDKVNYQKALEYAQKQIAYERLVHDRYMEANLAEFEKKYNYIAEKEKNNELTIRNNQVWIWLLGSLTACLIILAGSLAWVVWSRKLMARKDRKIGELNLEADEHRKEIASLKEAIVREQETIRKLEIEKNAAGEDTPRSGEIDVQIKKSEKNIDLLSEKIRQSCAMELKVHLKIYERYEHFKMNYDEKTREFLMIIDRHFYGETGKINWDTVSPMMPKNFEKTVKNKYKKLNTNEVRLCCLLLFDLSYTDIANILPLAQGSAYTTANRIKGKLGITNIPEALKHLLRK